MRQTSLRRVLSRWDLIVYGLVILTPTAPYPIFGLVQGLSHGHVVVSYAIAMAAVLFTAASYAQMSAAFPSAGSTYTYASEGLSRQLGFVAGWAMILDYFLIPLVSIIYIAVTATRIIPEVPYAVWAVLLTTTITAINVTGIRVTARAGNGLMLIMTVCAVLFFVLAVRFVAGHAGWSGLFSWGGISSREPGRLQPLIQGAGVAMLSFVGFDAISTMAEDAVQPERDIGFATITVCIVQGAVCLATVYLAALAWPPGRVFTQIETAILDVGLRIGGYAMFGFMAFTLLVAALASALTGQAGASRLVFAMSRDGTTLPRMFADVHPRYRTPTRALYAIAAVSLAAAFVMRFQLAVELLNFGALTGFILVNLSVVRHFYFRLGRRRGIALVRNLIVPLLGSFASAYVWMGLSGTAKLAGLLWLALGLGIAGFRSRFGLSLEELHP